MNAPESCDLLVIGAGPAGQKAAVQAAKAGHRAVLIERERRAGGECVHRGTIPSKTLRESALFLSGLRQRAAGCEAFLPSELDGQTTVSSLMQRLATVLSGHEEYMSAQLARNHVRLVHGRARFVSPTEVDVMDVQGRVTRWRAPRIVIASGSRPRTPEGIDVDHEHVLDSDSILSMIYLPRSLIVLGAGVIASEFATIFQSLGVAVTMVDRGERPLAFFDPEVGQRFLDAFRNRGGTFMGSDGPRAVTKRGVGAGVVVELKSGASIQADKVLAALGRSASVSGLGLDRIGLAINARGYIEVDEHMRTAVESVYAVGDVVGPPALATSAMEQGRRAARHALGLPAPEHLELVPVGIYTIPELACIGMTEAEARAAHGEVLVGRARFDELARGQINGLRDGLMKMVCDASGNRILGVQIVGEGATELVHLAQLAMLGDLAVDALVENVFNFPTLAEAYRVAALDVIGQRARLRRAG